MHTKRIHDHEVFACSALAHCINKTSRVGANVDVGGGGGGGVDDDDDDGDDGGRGWWP